MDNFRCELVARRPKEGSIVNLDQVLVFYFIDFQICEIKIGVGVEPNGWFGVEQAISIYIL